MLQQYRLTDKMGLVLASTPTAASSASSTSSAPVPPASLASPTTKMVIAHHGMESFTMTGLPYLIMITPAGMEYAKYKPGMDVSFGAQSDHPLLTVHEQAPHATVVLMELVRAHEKHVEHETATSDATTVCARVICLRVQSHAEAQHGPLLASLDTLLPRLRALRCVVYLIVPEKVDGGTPSTNNECVHLCTSAPRVNCQLVETHGWHDVPLAYRCSHNVCTPHTFVRLGHTTLCSGAWRVSTTEHARSYVELWPSEVAVAIVVCRDGDDTFEAPLEEWKDTVEYLCKGLRAWERREHALPFIHPQTPSLLSSEKGSRVVEVLNRLAQKLFMAVTTRYAVVPPARTHSPPPPEVAGAKRLKAQHGGASSPTPSIMHRQVTFGDTTWRDHDGVESEKNLPVSWGGLRNE